MLAYSVYHSCANIYITGSVPPASFTYTNPANAGTWSKGESAPYTGEWQTGADTTEYQFAAAASGRRLGGLALLWRHARCDGVVQAAPVAAEAATPPRQVSLPRTLPLAVTVV